jgi:hypothetical protein
MRLRRLQEYSIADQSVIRNVECLLLATFNWLLFRDLRRHQSRIFWHVFRCNIYWHVLPCASSYLVTRNSLAVTPSECYLRSKGVPGLVVAYHFRIYCLTEGWYEPFTCTFICAFSGARRDFRILAMSCAASGLFAPCIIKAAMKERVSSG